MTFAASLLLQCHMICQKSNMPICCSRHIYYYYHQCFFCGNCKTFSSGFFDK